MIDFTAAAATALRTLVQDVASNGTPTTKHGITITTSGRFQFEGKRIGLDRAIELIAEDLAAEADAAPAPAAPEAPEIKQPKRTGFAWESLNEATQTFFFGLCEYIQEATHDHGMTASARLGVDIPAIGLANAPRLSNCKKSNIIETIEGSKKSHKHIRLTDAGRALWFAHTGSSPE